VRMRKVKSTISYFFLIVGIITLVSEFYRCNYHIDGRISIIQFFIGWIGYYYYYPVVAALEFIINIFQGPFSRERCSPYLFVVFLVVLQNVVYYFMLTTVIGFFGKSKSGHR
jgi:hypothetical protein